MVYIPTTPTDANEDPSVSQPNITENFEVLNTSNSVNHGAFNDPDQGKHKFMQMPEQGSAPSTAANEGALYTAVGGSSAITELVYKRAQVGAVTGATIAFTETAGSAGSGWTRLPSGLILGWQSATVSIGSTVTMLGMTTIYQVVATIDGSTDLGQNFTLATGNIAGNVFTVGGFAIGGTEVRFIAIGV